MAGTSLSYNDYMKQYYPNYSWGTGDSGTGWYYNGILHEGLNYNYLDSATSNALWNDYMGQVGSSWNGDYTTPVSPTTGSVGQVESQPTPTSWTPTPYYGGATGEIVATNTNTGSSSTGGSTSLSGGGSTTGSDYVTSSSPTYSGQSWTDIYNTAAGNAPWANYQGANYLPNITMPAQVKGFTNPDWVKGITLPGQVKYGATQGQNSYGYGGNKPSAPTAPATPAVSTAPTTATTTEPIMSSADFTAQWQADNPGKNLSQMWTPDANGNNVLTELRDPTTGQTVWSSTMGDMSTASSTYTPGTGGLDVAPSTPSTGGLDPMPSSLSTSPTSTPTPATTPAVARPSIQTMPAQTGGGKMMAPASPQVATDQWGNPANVQSYTNPYEQMLYGNISGTDTQQWNDTQQNFLNDIMTQTSGANALRGLDSPTEEALAVDLADPLMNLYNTNTQNLLSAYSTAGTQGLEQRGQDVTQRGQTMDSLLGQMNANVTMRGQDLNAMLQEMGYNVDMRGQDINSLLTQMGYSVEQRNTDIQAALEQRGQDVTTLANNQALEASLASTNASLYNSLLNYTSTMTNQDLEKYIAELQAAVSQRGQDLTLQGQQYIADNYGR